MEQLGNILQNRAKPRSNKNIHSALHALADEIYQKSPKLKGDFGFILGRIKALGGVSMARARWNAAKAKQEPFKYFIAKW